MLNRRNNNQTNRQQISTSTFKALASPTNNNSTSIMSNERKISLATEGLQRSVKNWLRIKTSNENALAISEYVLLLRREVNPSQNYTKIQNQALVELSEYLKQKPFKQLTTEDVLSFLDKFRKNTLIDLQAVQWVPESLLIWSIKCSLSYKYDNPTSRVKDFSCLFE